MLSIGEFSKICEVSTKTLRYYSEIGLIYPEEVNPENGYRYYSIGQLKKMLFINRLKTYHLSLEEIKGILDLSEDRQETELYSVLNRKRREIQKKADAIAYTLKQLNDDLSKLEQGVSMMSYLEDIEVQLVETSMKNILFLRRMLTSDDYTAGYGVYFSKLYERIAADKLTMDGTPMTLYHSPEYNPTGNDTEFAIPILECAKGTRDLAGGLCARSVHKGSYAGLTSVYARLREWVEKEKYEIASAPYEVYITNPGQVSSPDELITEVYFPVRKM